MPPNDDRAMRLFRKACDSARSDACTDLATMYCMGRGMPRDVERSAALKEKQAAEERLNTAAVRLKEVHDKLASAGIKVTPDAVAALRAVLPRTAPPGAARVR